MPSLSLSVCAGRSSPETQSHLSRVYGTLVAGVVFSALGVYIEGVAHVAGTMTQLATLGMLLWILFDQDVMNVPKVWVAVVCAGFFRRRAPRCASPINTGATGPTAACFAWFLACFDATQPVFSSFVRTCV